jgi:hypothetical protein
MPWYWYIPFLVAVIGFILEITCLVQRQCRRRSLRAMGALMLLYFIALMSVIIWADGSEILLVRNGFFSAIGVSILLALHIADIFAGRD